MTSTHAGTTADQAISELMEEYADQIYGMGLRMCDDPERAQDLVQETFTRAFKAWDGFDGRSKPSTWLYTIASRACQRLQRRKSGEPRHMRRLDQAMPTGETTVVDLPDDGQTPLEWVEREEVIRAVRRAIDSLPMHFRLPVVLKEMEGISVEDVAAILNLKPATVKTRLHRARLLIREELSKPLPHRPAQDVHASESSCMDLLWAKQEALDRGVSFPIPDDELCERCTSVFATLDLAGEACHAIGDVQLPEQIRQKLQERVLGKADKES